MTGRKADRTKSFALGGQTSVLVRAYAERLDYTRDVRKDAEIPLSSMRIHSTASTSVLPIIRRRRIQIGHRGIRRMHGLYFRGLRRLDHYRMK